MKIRHLLFAALLLGLCLGKTSQAEEPTRFRLDLNRLPPKAGDEAERTIQILSTMSETNWTQGRESITNDFHFFELEGREKVLNWDVSDDWAKIEMVVNRLVDGDGHRTNELLKSGTRIVGTALLGAASFTSEGKALPREVYRQLERSYPIRPREFHEFVHFQIPQPKSIGESWEIAAPTNIEELAGFGGPSFTNSVKATAQFVGITNLFGFNCFHLRGRIRSTEMPEHLRNVITSHLPVSIKAQVNITMDLIVPFDTSQRILRESYFIEFLNSSEMVIDGKNVMSSRGQTTLEIISEFRPITPR